MQLQAQYLRTSVTAVIFKDMLTLLISNLTSCRCAAVLSINDTRDNKIHITPITTYMFAYYLSLYISKMIIYTNR